MLVSLMSIRKTAKCFATIVGCIYFFGRFYNDVLYLDDVIHMP